MTEKPKRPTRARGGATRGALSTGFDPFAKPTLPVAPSADLPEGSAAAAPAETAAPPAEVREVVRVETREVVKEVPVPLLDAEAIAGVLPELHGPRGTEPVLAADEAAELEEYRRVLRFADSLYWVKGRALAGIDQGDLGREEYKTFAEFVEAEAGMKVRRAYQLIEVWELGAHLHGVCKILHTAPTVESQTRALLPLSAKHGFDAAGTVVEAFAKAGVKMTAGRLEAALKVIPDGDFDSGKTLELLAEYLKEPVVVIPPQREETDPAADVFTAELNRLQGAAKKVAKAAVKDPEGARRFADELTNLADEIRNQIS